MTALSAAPHAARISRRLPRLLLASDWPVLHEHLQREIPKWSEFDLVDAVSGGELLQSLELLKPDIVLAGPLLKESPGEDEILAVAEGITRVVFISDQKQPAVSDALSLGAAGYLTMDADKHELRSTLKQVANDRVGFSATAQRLHVQQLLASSRDDRPSISERERQVLRLMARGMRSPEISKQLLISHWTVRTHTQNIYRKLGVNNRAGVVGAAIRHKLI